MHTPKSGVFQTRTVFICERPIFGSLISDKAMELIQQLETFDKNDALKPDNEVNGKPDEPVDSLVKAAMRLSHASSVAIVTLDDISTKGGFSVLSILKSLVATRTKDIVLLVPEEKYPEWTNVISSCVDLKMLKRPVRVNVIEKSGEFSKKDILKIFRPVLSTMDGLNPDGELPRKFTALVGCNKEGIKGTEFILYLSPFLSYLKYKLGFSAILNISQLLKHPVMDCIPSRGSRIFQVA